MSIAIDLISSDELRNFLLQNTTLVVERYIKSKTVFEDIYWQINRKNSKKNKKKKFNIDEFFYSSTAQYLVIDLLRYNLVDAAEEWSDLYEHRQEEEYANLLGFRRICENYFSALRNPYKKVIILVEKPEPTLRNDKNLWLCEEIIAAARNIGKIQNVMIPLKKITQTASRQYVPRLRINRMFSTAHIASGYFEASFVINKTILEHFYRIPDFNVSAQLNEDQNDKNTKIEAEISFGKKATLSENYMYTFYLLRYGTVVEQIDGYSSYKSHIFDISEAGIYVIQGFVKDNLHGTMLYKYSAPIAYFPQDIKLKYKYWLEDYKTIDTPMHQPYTFIPNPPPFCDYAIILDLYNIDTPKSPYLQNGFELIHLLPQGEWQVALFTNGVLKQTGRILGQRNNNKAYLWSGHSIDTYGNVCENGTPETITNSVGSYSLVEIGENILIRRDNFGMEHLFVYKSDYQVIVSNRYHLLLMLINTIGLKINETIAINKFLSMNNQMFQNHIGYKTDIDGVEIVPFYKDILIDSNGLSLIDNHIGTEIKIIQRFHYETYFNLFDQAISEIKSNVKSFLDYSIENNKTAIFDLSGGLDSRLIYSALISFDYDKSNVKIRSNDVVNDLPIALEINIEGFPYDDLPETLIRYPITRSRAIFRSQFEGMYLTSRLGQLVHENADFINIYGAHGEIARPYWVYPFFNTFYDDLENEKDKAIYRISAFYPTFLTGSENIQSFSNYYSGIKEYGGMSQPLTQWMLMNSYHFQSKISRLLGLTRFAPLDSKAMYLSNVYSMPIFNSIKHQFSLIEHFAPELLSIKFADEDMNTRFSEVLDYMFFALNENKNSESEKEVIKKNEIKEANILYEKKLWNAANNKKKKLTKTTNIQEINIATNEEITALWNVLHELFMRFPIIEEKIGLHLWYFACENINNSYTRTEIYNKCCSVLDEMDIVTRSQSNWLDGFSDAVFSQQPIDSEIFTRLDYFDMQTGMLLFHPEISKRIVDELILPLSGIGGDNLSLIETDVLFKYVSAKNSASILLWIHSLSFLIPLIESYEKSPTKTVFCVIENVIASFLEHINQYTARQRYDSEEHALYIRTVVLLKVLHTLPFETEFQNSILRFLGVQSQWLLDFPKHYLRTHQGVMQCFGILYMVAFIDGEIGATYAEDSFVILQKLINKSFDEEGFCNENSPGYWRYNILLYRSILSFAKHYNINSPVFEEIGNIISQASTALQYVLPTHQDERVFIPSIGDSGNFVINDFSSIKGTKCFLKGGFFVHQDEKFYLTFKCGWTNSSHKHADETSITLRYLHQDIFVDPGFYDYDWQGLLRPYLCSPRAHCGIFPETVLDMDMRTYLNTVSQARFEKDFVINNQGFSVSGSYYVRDTNSTVRRQISSSGYTLIITDSWFSEKPQNMYSQFALHPDATIVSMDERNAIIEIGNVQAQLTVISPNEFIMFSDKGWYSANKNEVRENQIINFLTMTSNRGQIVFNITLGTIDNSDNQPLRKIKSGRAINILEKMNQAQIIQN